MKTMICNKTNSKNYWLWLVVVLLTMLIMVTWTLLAGIMKSTCDVPRDVIALIPQDSGENGHQPLYRPVDGEDGSVTRDKKAQWTSRTDIDLFQSAYTDADGKITVNAGNGDKIIAPGTTNCYVFSIQNTGKHALSYSAKIQSVLNADNRTAAMEFRLRRGCEWLIGNEAHWASMAELNDAEEKANLAPDKSDQFLLEWRWVFDGDDEEDTALAAIASGRSDALSLTISTVTETVSNAVSVNGSGKLLSQRMFGLKEIALFVLDLVLLVGLLLLLLWRRSVYVTGFVLGTESRLLSCGHKHSGIRPDGRFVFSRVYTGKRRFTFGNVRLDWHLKRKGGVDGIRFEKADDGTPVVVIGRDIRAIEISLKTGGDEMAFTTSHWAAIDHKNKVYTQDGVYEPDKNGCNQTPDGLMTDKHKKYSFSERESVVQ